jgi:hypothetical protein
MATVNITVNIVTNRDIERISILDVCFSISIRLASAGNRRIKIDINSGIKVPASKAFGNIFRIFHSSPAGWC